jgi:hypothetical protein
MPELQVPVPVALYVPFEFISKTVIVCWRLLISFPLTAFQLSLRGLGFSNDSSRSSGAESHSYMDPRRLMRFPAVSGRNKPHITKKMTGELITEKNSELEQRSSPQAAPSTLVLPIHVITTALSHRVTRLSFFSITYCPQ